MADYTTQAQQAALDALDADFQQVFDRWVEFAPWKHAEKGGAGSGNFGHAGRQGERGGSASSADYTALTDLDITATAAMRYAQEALDSGRRHGILAGNVPQHYQELGFSEGTVKTLRDLGNLYGYGGDNQKRAVQQMITALYDGSDLGDALRAQIATETQLVQMYRDHVPAFWEKERERAADDWDWAKTQQANQDEVYIRGGTYPQDGKEQFLASERRTFLQSVSQLYRKGGLDNPIQSWTTDSAGAWMGNAGHIGWDHSLTWDDVERDYYVLAGLGINYGAPGEHEITLIRKDAVPPRESVKGGAGSGNFDHEGRQGLRGGSADDGTPNSPGVSGGSVTHTQAMQLAQQRLGAGLPGNFLSNQAGKHFMQLGFKGPVIKQLYDLSQMYKAGGKQQELAVNHIMTALSDGSELGRALRAQIDTETALAKAKINPARAKLPASKPATGKQGMSAQDKQKRDEAAHNAKQKAEELAGQKRDAQQAEADARAERRGQVGKTEFLGSSPIATVIDQGDTVVSNGQPIAWTEVLSTHHVLAGLGVAYGKRGQIALIRQDAIPPLQPPAKGGSGSGFFDHAGRPGQQGGSAPSASHPDAGTPVSVEVIKRRMKSWSADLQNGKFDRDPVIRAFLGGSMGTNPPSDLQRIKEREPLFKHAVVSALAQGIGVSYNDANAFIKQWALSSNKGLTAQVIQKATADEFDLPFSDWQRTRYDKYEQLWADAIHLQSVNMLLTKKLDAQDEAAITKAILDTLPFPEAAKADLAHLWPKDFQFAQSKDNYDLVESRMAQVADIANHVRYLAAERTKRALRFLYEETQRDLQAQGIDEVILYRGFSSSTVADLPQGSSVTVSANTLSSWSADDGIASLFASRYDSDSDTVDPAGAVFAMRVPAKRIFSTPRTGFGCLHEFEFVVLGHDQDEATVASTIHGDKETFIDLGDLWEEEKAANLPPIVALDNSDDNADWIKQVHGGEAQRRELAIHEELAARFAAKGGPGSGFHDHAGRPGERGGSAPSGLPPTSVPSVEEIRENTEGFVDDLHALNFETDPVIRGFVGGNDGTGDGYLTHLTRRAPQLKHAVVTKLADALGVDYKDANAFIKEWANSSNEGFIAQTIQKAAADEFGVPQSDWQRKQYDESVASWEKTLQERLDRITHFGQVTADQADALCSSCLKDAPFFERAWDGIKERFPEGITLDKTDDAEVVAAYRERVETAVRQSRADQVDLTRRALRFLYDETQRDLKDLRLDEVLLYRGYVTQGAASLDLGETVTVASNALASWSAERETAEMFATGLSFHEGAAFAVKVPAARVFSTPRTGFGCLLEWEFVLLGGAKDAARVVFTIGNGEKHTLKSLDTPEDTMAKRVINLDDSDTNADWIKRVRGGESQRRELAIHEELARANGQPVTDPTEEGWPDVPETNEDDAGDPSTD